VRYICKNIDYKHEYEYIAYDYEYKYEYKYFKFVLELYSSTSMSTEYYISGAQSKRCLQCSKMSLAAGLCPDPLGELMYSPRPFSRNKRNRHQIQQPPQHIAANQFPPKSRSCLAPTPPILLSQALLLSAVYQLISSNISQLNVNMRLHLTALDFGKNITEY